MDWGIIIWGLLIGMAGMIWMIVLATWRDDSPKGSSAEDDAHAADRATEPTTARPTERRTQTA
ncbi:MAG: hypothetical protein ACT4OO_03960 [Nitrospiraceae bacterium]